MVRWDESSVTLDKPELVNDVRKGRETRVGEGISDKPV